MDPGLEEHLVGVDVADAGDPRLVEEQALDAALPRREDEPRSPRVRPRAARDPGRPARRRRLRLAFEAEQEAELPDVAEPELVPAVLEADDQPGVLVARRALRPANRNWPVILRWKTSVRPPSHAMRSILPRRRTPRMRRPRKASSALRPPVRSERTIEELDPRDDAAADARRERPGDRFDFGQLGHGDIYHAGREIGDTIRFKRFAHVPIRPLDLAAGFH